MKKFFIAATLLAPFLLSPVHTQVNSNLAGAIAQLLDHPAPPPSPPKELAEALAAMNGSARGYVSSDPPDPGEDAPVKVLIAYWLAQAREETGQQPSEKVRQRLLQACEEEPEFFPDLLDFLPNTPAAHARVKRILDEEPNANFDPFVPFRKESRQGLREWLMRNSEYLRGELIREAGGAEDEDGNVKGSRELAALALLDWRTAEPLLKKYAEGAAPRTAAFALGLLYEHAAQNNRSAEADAYRARLDRVVGDPQAPGRARAIAVEALMKADWQGRDEWFLSLFADHALSEMRDGYATINALIEPVKRDPDRWIPFISPLIGHGNRNVHNAAALCLAQFVGRRARKDALLPLLPWLSDAQWALPSTEQGRALLAESAGRLKMREALPGLIWMIRNEKEYIRSHAADALALTRDGSVVTVLREAIRAGKKGDDDYSTFTMTKALIACGGLSIEETVAALEYCAAKAEISVEDHRGERYLNIGSHAESVEIWVGQIVAKQEEYASEALAEAVIERLKTLRKEKPEIAAKLWMITQQWRFPSVDLELVGQIADGSANLDALLMACERRQSLRSHAGGALRELVAAGGYQAGAGAALLGDQASALDILNGDDRAARLALLACARMLREPLPIEKVGALLKSSDKLLAHAAERYLESEDGADARKLILALRPGEALILGARNQFDPKPEHKKDWIRWEDRLREDVKKNQADEIFAALGFQYFDTAPILARFSAIVRVRQGKAELCKQEDGAREECRQLADGELRALRDLYKEVSFDNLGPINLSSRSIGGGSEGEFVKLDKSGGRRIYASNLYDLNYYLPYKAKKPHFQLDIFFRLLCATGEFELRYALKAKIKELEALSTDDRHPVKCICKQGDDVRALVKEKDSGWNETDGARKWEEEVWRWHSVVNNKLGEIADQPDACPIPDAQEDLPEEMVRIDIRKKQVTKVETDNFYFLTLAPGSGKVYFQGHRGERMEHLLLDPASGKLEVAQGEFAPLIHQNLRPLQPVAGSREYWAAIPDSEKNLTRVGRYDARAFSFKPLMEIPEIYFTSEMIWVDEAAQLIYLAYHGHLLRLPLIVNLKSSGK